MNTERRKYIRFKYEADISHDLITQTDIHNGKVYNFSKGGLYFVSSQTIYPGEEIFIKFEHQQDAINDDNLTQLPFGVKILWQKDLSDSSFRYGYGAQYIDNNDSLVKSIKIPGFERINRPKNPLDTEKDPREYPRRLYRKSLILSHKNQSYKGQFANISRGGVFIKADTKFLVGKQIQIVIPGSEFRKNIKLKGWIVRRNSDGFGVKFDRRTGREDRKDLERRTGADRRSVFDRRDRK